MKISKTLLPVVAVAALFSGCQDEDFGYEAQDIKYEKEFKAAFGTIDPNQDFNLATRANVTVSTTTTANIKIYAKHGNRYQLVGDYANVSGTRTLAIDVMEGTTELRVTNGSFSQETTVGGSVSFDGSDLTRGVISTSISTPTTDMLEMSEALAKAWVKVIPERGDRSKALTYGTNLGKVLQDFTYVSNGEFTMYPMYSCTNSSDVIGIYYTDADGGYHEVEVMNNTFDGSNLQFKRHANEVGEPDADWQNVVLHYPTYGLITDGGDGSKILDNIAAVRGKGVTINLPKGTVFGMFLRQGNTKFYSESALNGDIAVTDVENEEEPHAHTITNDATKHGCHAASFYCTVEGKEYQFLGFEDWDNGYDGGGRSDFDLNDFMVLFDGVLPLVNDEETPGWILAYEDLGNSYDWDYNDIIAKVQHVSGQNYVTFTALAAVGTLDSYIKYNGEYITGTKATSEVHSMFGATDQAPHAVINGSARGESTAKSITFTVPEDFSMTTLGAADALGGISLVVENDGEIIANVDYAGVGNTPKVICLPEFWYDDPQNPKYKYEWAWPTEHSSIKAVYPEFAAWVADKTVNPEWYKHPNTNCTPGQGGEVGNDETGSYVSGSFSTKMASGTISERADQPITVLVPQNKLYMAYHETVDFSALYTTRSTGTITVTSANTEIVTTNNGALWGAEVGTTTVSIHQTAGADKEDETKMWPTCDETVEVIVLNANNLYIGTIDEWNFYEKSEITLTAGEVLNLYFKSDAHTSPVTTYTPADATIVSAGTVQGAAVQYADGFAAITALKAGETTLTVSQAMTDTYMSASKDITIKVNKGTTNLSLSTNSVTVGRTNTAEVDVITNNTLTNPTVEVTEGSDYFTAVYQSGKIVITGTANGSGTITVSQAGNDSYEAATPQTISVEVTDPQHDLQLTSTTSVTLATATATSQIAATSSTGTVKYEVTEGTSLISVSATGEISVLDGPGQAKVRVYVEASDDYLGAEKFVDVNVTFSNYGTRIETSEFSNQIGAPNSFYAFKIAKSSMPADKKLKVILVQNGGYVQLYCATASWGADMTIYGSQGQVVSGTKDTNDITADYFICVEQGYANLENAQIYYKYVE